MDELSFTNEELEIFFNKFSKENLDIFNLILYFSSFSGNMVEIVERLKIVKDKVYSNKDISRKIKIENEISLLNKKELEMLSYLLDEASFCASSDNRFIDESKYLEYLKFTVDNNLERILHNKRKVLYL